MYFVKIGNITINLEYVTMIDANYKWVEHEGAKHTHREGVLIRFADGSKRILDAKDGARFIKCVNTMAAAI